MIKVKVKSIKDGSDYAASFNTDVEADKWIEKQTQLKSWGDTEADFLIEKEDITAQVNEEKQIAKVSTEQAIGKKVKDKLSAIIRYKLITSQITIQQLAVFVELPSVIRVERYLDNGYLTLAKMTMQSGDFGDIISEEERQQFIAEL